MHSPPGTPASTVSRSGPGKSVFQSRLSPPISVGWQAKLATTAIGSPSSPSTRSTGTLSSTGRSRRTLLTLIPGARPVPQPTRAGFRPRQAAYTAPASRSGRDSTHGANEPVSASPATVEPRETLGALWLCAAFTSTASGGIPVSVCTRSRTAAVMSAPAKTRSIATIATCLLPSSRTSACPIIGSRTPSARPVRAATSSPWGQAGRRRDVDSGDAGGMRARELTGLISRPLSHCWATSSAYASGRRFLSANQGFSRARSTSAGSSSTVIHWSPVPGSECASIDPSGART